MKKLILYKSDLNNFTGSEEEVKLNDINFIKEERKKKDFNKLKIQYQKKIDSFRLELDITTDPSDFLFQKIKEVGHIFEHRFPNDYETYKKLTSEKRNKSETTLRFEDFTTIQISLDKNIRDLSITHYAPIGKKTNWYGDKSLPTSYPGFSGEIYFELKNDAYNKISFMSDFLKCFPINAGSGGSASIRTTNKNVTPLRYSISLFIDDFPKLKESYNKFCKLTEKVSKEQETFNSEVMEKINTSPEIRAEKILLKGYKIKLEQLSKIIYDYETNINKMEKLIKSKHISSFRLTDEERQQYKNALKYYGQR